MPLNMAVEEPNTFEDESESEQGFPVGFCYSPGLSALNLSTKLPPGRMATVSLLIGVLG